MVEVVRHMSVPVISVVMSVYNGEQYLREAIDSILNQTFDAFEFIIIDDGSTDGSADIIRSYEDQRIRFVQQKNAGLAAALNKGVELAKGIHIARMDADDISLLDRLSIQYEYMLVHPDIDILGGHAFLIDEMGERFGEKKKPVNSDAIKNCIGFSCPLIHPTYMVKKDVYQDLGGYRSEFSVAQDYDFLLRAYDSGKKIENINKYLVCYRVEMRSIRHDRERYQMFLTRLILELHRQRVKNGKENIDLLRSISEYSLSSGCRFRVANRLRSFFLMKAKTKKRLLSRLFMMLVIVSSCLDYELFRASLRGFLYKRASHER